MKNLLQSLSLRFGVVRQIFSYIYREKMWFLIPVVAILVLLSLFIVFAQTSPLAPFIYTLF